MFVQNKTWIHQGSICSALLSSLLLQLKENFLTDYQVNKQ